MEKDASEPIAASATEVGKIPNGERTRPRVQCSAPSPNTSNGQIFSRAGVNPGTPSLSTCHSGISSEEPEILPGRGHLRVETISGQSAVTSSWASSPLKILVPRPRGPSVWAYFSSFGGGLVAGDETSATLDIGEQSRCFVSTQASTKVYRNPESRPCGHQLAATLGANSLLVFAPDPVQAFAGSSYAQRQSFHLGPGSGLVLVDWLCSGRAARGERWAFDRFQSRNEIFVGEERVLLDSLLLDPDDGPLASPHTVTEPKDTSKQTPLPNPLPFGSGEGEDSASGDPPPVTESQGTSEETPLPSPLPFGRGEGEESAQASAALVNSMALSHRMGRFNCLALVLVIGDLLRDAGARALEDIAARPITRAAPLICSASPVSHGTLLRFAGERVEDVAGEIHRQLAFLPALLHDDPWSRKW
jgi:urease accessory protein UreH